MSCTMQWIETTVKAQRGYTAGRLYGVGNPFVWCRPT